jgi:DNA-binding MarR family transcriptional regulator
LAASRKRQRIADLAHPLSLLGRDVGIAAMAFHNCVAARLGLNPTDHRCVEILQNTEHATAGDLADRIGLTTGAVTAVIDRLEKAGFVRRAAHPTDRRSVVIQTVPERYQELSRLFVPLAQGMSNLCARYSEAELKVIMDYLTRSAELFRRETSLLQSQNAALPDKSM